MDDPEAGRWLMVVAPPPPPNPSRPARRPKRRPVYVSLFCGIGGETTGAIQALEELGLGRPNDGVRVVAVNHDRKAILSHHENHPNVEHFDCDVEKLDPDEVLDGDQITCLWISAPCQPYSDAAQPNRRRRKDGKLASLPYTRPQHRATPAYAIDWIVKGKPLVIIEENVPGIIKKWKDWPQHLKDIESLGYDLVVTPRSNAADFGVPQDRRRMIMVAVKKGYPLKLPTPEFSDPDKPKPGTKPWVPAKTVIDRSLYCPPIFNRRTTTGKPKPLAPSVRNRIGRYLDELGPFWRILADATRKDNGPVPLRQALEAVPEDQWPSIIRREGNVLHIMPHEPWLTKFYNNARDGQSLDETLPAITAGGGHIGVVEPHVEVTQGFLLGQQGGATPRPLSKVGPTIPTACYVRLGEFGFILPKRGPGGGQFANPARPMERPLNAQVAGRDSSAVVDVGIQVTDGVILPHNGERKGKTPRHKDQKPRIHPTTKTMPTVCAELTKHIAFAFLYTYNGNANVTSLERPGTTITTVERHAVGEVQMVVQASLDECFLTVGLRMLSLREQANGQGCPPNYILACKTKKDNQRHIGNMVPPPMAKAYVQAALEPLVPLLVAE